MDPVEDLEFAIEWYRDVVPRRSDRPGPLAPNPTDAAQVLDQIRRELHPIVLPPELAWFWTTWGPLAVEALFDVTPGPRLTTAAFALDFWHNQTRGEFPGVPRNLFPVAYESHGFLLADLAAAGQERAAPLWLYYFDFDAYQLHYPSLASMFRSVATTFESVGLSVPADRSRWDGGHEVLLSQSFDATRRAALTAAGMDGRRNAVPVLDQRQWPESWRVAHGLTQADMEVRGATHTVAELVAAAARAPLTARLHGRCHGAVGAFEIAGERVDIRRFTDATGTIDVLQPVGLRAVGITGDVLLEIEVECPGPFGTTADTSNGACDLIAAAASNDPDRMTAAIDDLFSSRYPDADNLPRIRRMVAIV